MERVPSGGPTIHEYNNSSTVTINIVGKWCQMRPKKHRMWKLDVRIQTHSYKVKGHPTRYKVVFSTFNWIMLDHGSLMNLVT